MRLSPRQRRLVEYLLTKPRWVQTSELCAVEFGDNDKRWPWNCRLLVTSAMYVAMQKLKHNNNGIQVEKVGGGRAGVSYRVKR